jgi:hypothetical protein
LYKKAGGAKAAELNNYPGATPASKRKMQTVAAKRFFINGWLEKMRLQDLSCCQIFKL